MKRSRAGATIRPNQPGAMRTALRGHGSAIAGCHAHGFTGMGALVKAEDWLWSAAADHAGLRQASSNIDRESLPFRMKSLKRHYHAHAKPWAWHAARGGECRSRSKF